jgi:hypothetical protein
MKLIIFGVGIPSSWYGPCSREGRIAIRGGQGIGIAFEFLPHGTLDTCGLEGFGTDKKSLTRPWCDVSFWPEFSKGAVCPDNKKGGDGLKQIEVPGWRKIFQTRGMR